MRNTGPVRRRVAGVRRQDVRRCHVRHLEQQPQLGGDLGQRTRQLDRVAPAGVGPVVQHAGGERADPVVQVEAS
ncbi:hypothetical protein ACIBI9_60350 [Nonomuraea sp. NPDC050451]|uniref:hypothetical protein n=1 Tax=Nonomuraea sp. NPDC050451 TaxID=3364364 RepID=UPI00379FB87E